MGYNRAMKKNVSPHLALARHYWQGHLQPSDLAIDATCGNGHDTLFLADLCSVVALDIQEAALQNTRALLEQHNKQAVLHLASHAKIDQIPLPSPPKLIVYNLGYLPRGDKTITTTLESTLESVNKGLSLLAPGGALSITCYPGHDEGMREEKGLEKWIDGLRASTCHHKWVERPRAPSLIWICSMM